MSEQISREAEECPVCSWPNERYKTMQLKSGLWKEIRDAYEERDSVRHNIESIKAEAVNSVQFVARDELVSAIRRMSFWQRVRLLFNPFGVQL